MDEHHLHIFKSDSLKVPKMPFQFSLYKSYRLTGNSCKTKFVCSLFVGVQYRQISKPCLCGK